ncbi:hypothetical protein BZA70DRAFT_146 [Myxozyma melibiosi]|uniref:NAD(P)-binding protein n=1 Tax=Myxozyma melibiosi TaxID=54550 RepID=A0ABR1FAX0_9ASCO
MTASKVLEGKVALVTGASSGMGRATTALLASHGANIVCCDLNPKPNPKGFEKDLHLTTVEVVEQLGQKAIFCQVDISNLKQVEEAFTKAVETFGRLDINVNCAGFWAPFGPFGEETDELWQKMVAINTLGTSKCMRLAVKQFMKQEVDEALGSRGRIVNVSSCAGHFSFPGEVAYSATKAAVNHMTRAAATDHAKDYININVVAPGVVHTGMARGNIEDKDISALMKKSTPWPRLGTTQDIAESIVFLCLPGSQWITGQLLAVDGGMTLGVPYPT